MYTGTNVPVYARLASWEPLEHTAWYARLWDWSWDKVPVPDVLDEGTASDMHATLFHWQGPRSLDFWCAVQGREQVAGCYHASAPSRRVRWTPQVRVTNVERAVLRWERMGGTVLLQPCQILDICIMAVISSAHETDELILMQPIAYEATRSRGEGKLGGIELHYRNRDDLARYAELLDWSVQETRGSTRLLRRDDPVGWAVPVHEGLQRWVTYWGHSERTQAEAITDGARIAWAGPDRMILIDPWGAEFGLCEA